jgi:Mg2+-importing ATPase
VAKDAADIVLMEKDLGVLKDGIREGRITFANTLKYVFMATSANFGNMFSMAGASLFLKFLPMLPTQILLTNFMTDLPEMTIATDNVDPEWIDQPHRWDIGFIKRFMIVFGLANSMCDYITFGFLLFVMHADETQFQTGWFIENVVTAALIVLVVRTRRPFWKSKPSRPLVIATLASVGAVLLIPVSPLAGWLHLKPLPPSFIGMLAGLLVLYVVVAEAAKWFFYRGPKNSQQKAR